MTNNVTQPLPSSKPDVEIANELKAKIIEALQPALKVMDEAKEHGFSISFSLGPDCMGRHGIVQMQVSKLF